MEIVPVDFKQGIIIPIPKGKKDRSVKDNYCGIALPVI